MSTLHRIALLGFSPFERNTLGSYFRLASTREPRYEQVLLLPEADFVVADADHEPSVKLVLAVERLPETVFVGARAPEGAVAWVGRPIDPMRVLRELDVLAGRRMSQPAAVARAEAGGDRRRTVIQPVRPARPQPPAALAQPAAADELDLMLPDLPAPAQATPPAAPERAAPAAATSGAPSAKPAAAWRPPAEIAAAGLPAVFSRPTTPAAEPVAMRPPEPQAAAAAPRAATAAMPTAAAKAATARPVVVPRPPGGAPPRKALLVDDSEVALRFLQRKLAPYGLVTEAVASSDAAVKLLAERRYDFVFLDMELGERSALDGLSLCQHIKHGSESPNVVMVTAHHTELDRVRAALAGCDGFLGKPLDDQELALYLARFGLKAPASAGRAAS